LAVLVTFASLVTDALVNLEGNHSPQRYGKAEKATEKVAST
jgi:hypothetical protein